MVCLWNKNDNTNTKEAPVGTNSILAASVNGAPQPEVGMGATILMWSDRHAATIRLIDRFKTGARAGQVKAVWVTRDEAVRVDANGLSENQTWEFLPNPNAPYRKFTLRKSGRFEDAGGTTLAIGYRDEHMDPHF